MGTDIPMECGVQRKITEQLGLNATVCCDEFAMHKTAIFMVHGKLYHRDVLIPVSRNASLQFLLVNCIHGAQYHLEHAHVCVCVCVYIYWVYTHTHIY
jgi:hypothetical protein